MLAPQPDTNPLRGARRRVRRAAPTGRSAVGRGIRRRTSRVGGTNPRTVSHDRGPGESPRGAGSAEEGRLPSSAAKLERLGDFRIVREIGRGGMGIVYEAMQESLGRRVAVKVLARHARLDDTHRRRFFRKAPTAGRLHHTNIVPILGVGEQDGLDYFVMQYIEGVGLDSVIARMRLASLIQSASAFPLIGGRGIGIRRPHRPHAPDQFVNRR